MRTILFILLAFPLVISCKSKKVATTADETKNIPGSWIIKYERGPCFGKCPVYNLYVLTDHTGLIQVKENLIQPGWYAAALDQKAVDALLKTLESDKCWHPDLSDQPVISDQPSHHLEYKHPSGLRTLDIQSRYNTDLSNLFREINHLAVESKWEPTELRPIGVAAGTALDLIVQLKEDVDINTWIKKYESSFGATVKKKISPKQTFYLITKAPDKGTPDAFYQALKKDKDLIGVQFDSKTEQRR
jgi:hypothetical protein